MPIILTKAEQEELAQLIVERTDEWAKRIAPEMIHCDNDTWESIVSLYKQHNEEIRILKENFMNKKLNKL